MPYSITRSAEHLVWVVIEGHLTLDHAESYFGEMWELLDTSAAPTDLLVDGRRIAGAAQGARRRTEQIAHHPNLGHLAFVVGELHLLLFAPLVKLVSGIGLFGDEREAMDYLRAARGLPALADLGLPNLPPPPATCPEAHGAQPAPAPHPRRATHGRPALTRALPLPPTSRLKGTPLYAREPLHSSQPRRAGDGEAE